jgi:hypothetical protein
VKKILVLILFTRCGQPATEKPHPEKPVNGPEIVSSTVSDSLPTEIFSGTLKNKAFRFEHFRYTTYRLSTGSTWRSGKLNTERGYKNDRNATVYVLDHEGPENAQIHLVRSSAGGLHLLDGNGLIDTSAHLQATPNAKE